MGRPTKREASLKKRRNSVIDIDKEQKKIKRDVVNLAPKAKKMTPKQSAFVRHYMLHYNATRAAEEAGYRGVMIKDASFRILKQPHIRAEIDRRKAEEHERYKDLKEQVVEEFKNIAFADMSKIFDEDGNPRPINEIPLDTLNALDNVTLEGNKIKKYSPAKKTKALAELGKICGIYEKNNKQIAEIGFSSILNMLPEDVRGEVKLALMKRIKGKALK